MKSITSEEAAKSLDNFLDEISQTGETMLILKDAKPVATIAPVTPRRSVTVGEFFTELRKIKADPQFADDLDEVNKSDKPLENPWD